MSYDSSLWDDRVVPKVSNESVRARARKLKQMLNSRAEHFSSAPISTKEGAELATLLWEVICILSDPPVDG